MQAKQETKELHLSEDKDASLPFDHDDSFIDKHFKIVKAHYGKHLDDHVAMEEQKAVAGINTP